MAMSVFGVIVVGVNFERDKGDRPSEAPGSRFNGNRVQLVNLVPILYSKTAFSVTQISNISGPSISQ
jgi:hypothetical protein